MILTGKIYKNKSIGTKYWFELLQSYLYIILKIICKEKLLIVENNQQNKLWNNNFNMKSDRNFHYNQ